MQARSRRPRRPGSGAWGRSAPLGVASPPATGARRPVARPTRGCPGHARRHPTRPSKRTRQPSVKQLVGAKQPEPGCGWLATESDTVTTKVITNHNKTRALTMQYWEVLRMYGVTTAVDGVTLVCLVPLDVVRFLPAGHPPELQQAPRDRETVLSRYGELFKDADTLTSVLPPRYRQGLSLITEFAADPNSTVQTGSDRAKRPHAEPAWLVPSYRGSLRHGGLQSRDPRRPGAAGSAGRHDIHPRHGGERC